MRILWTREGERTDAGGGARKDDHATRPNPPEILPLGALAPGQSGTVTGVETRDGAGRLRLRLLDMGFVPGTRVEMLGTAPGGDPVLIRLRGYDLALRRGDASLVRVIAGGEGEMTSALHV